MTWRILNAEPVGYSAAARARLQEIAEVVEDPVPPGELARRAMGFDALIVRLAHRIDGETLAAEGLRAVVTATTGLDHIDLESAAKHGVEVLSLRGEIEFLDSIRATGEHTWALLLALVRNLPRACGHVLEGHWQRDLFRGRELAGKRLGILGLGRVGGHVAGYARAFQMSVAAYDPLRSGWVEGVQKLSRLEDLLRWSEILSVHLPLNEKTRGMVGRVELETLPVGALLINTARGDLIDEEALVALLESGHLGGAAVDVMSSEGREAERAHSPLLAYARQHGNLIVTPHVAGATFESMHRTEELMAEKLWRFLSQR